MGLYTWDLLDDDCSDIETSWTDADIGTAESTQVEYDGKQCFKLDSGPDSEPSNYYANIHSNIGEYSATTALIIKVKHTTLGTCSDFDFFTVQLYQGYFEVAIAFASDGLYVYDNGAYSLVGAAVNLNEWQSWCFHINWETQKVDVYLKLGNNWIAYAKNVGCYHVYASYSGRVSLIQYGRETNNCITYIDTIKMMDRLFMPDAVSNYIGTTITNAVQIYPLPEFWRGKIQSTTEARLKGGGLLLYRWSNYEQIKIPVSWVTASDAALVNSWWENQSPVQFYVSSGSEIDVTSCMIMNKETPLNQYNEPHTDYFRGNILLEGY